MSIIRDSKTDPNKILPMKYIDKHSSGVIFL